MRKLKLIKKLGYWLQSFAYILLSTKLSVLAAGEDSSPYYDDTEDTAGALDPIITIALIAYVIGLLLFLYGKMWERRVKKL